MIRTDFVYGPVPSRRLGLSLGINIIPRKTCTLDCCYCQLGRTTRKTLQRCSFFPVADILAQVRAAVRHSRNAGGKSRISFLTFSGEGEPTLNSDIGRLIRRLKREFSIPVAVITNSTLITDPQVRRDLYAADLVVPSLDAADQRTFMKVDRGHRSLKIAAIIAGLKLFRRHYRGQLWLEIMLVRGINDSPEQLMQLRRAAWEIRPDRVHLNTVVRPPAEKWARPLPPDDLEQVKMLFGPGTDIAESTLPPRARPRKADPEAAIIATVRSRPVTREDLTRALGLSPARLRPLLARLVRARKIRRVVFWGKLFYEA
uniref:Radical SAM protein n=1 Tax=candidate division WOR-3 bacterium TaxID=2052148 RepID=A0A7C4CD86_UNCW3